MQPRHRLLIVEDDHSTQELLKTVAEMYGFNADLASDGDSGWFAMERRAHDVVLLDLLLPRRSGVEILGAVKAHMPELMRRIIVATALTAREMSDGELDGVWCIRRKPLDIFDLIHELRLCATQ